MGHMTLTTPLLLEVVCRWTRQPPKLPLSIGKSGPHGTHGSLDPHESAPIWHLGRFTCFCTAHPCKRMQTRADHATSDIFALHGMWPKNYIIPELWFSFTNVDLGRF